MKIEYIYYSLQVYSHEGPVNFLFPYRYPVAIKVPKKYTEKECTEFLEEAKSMLEIKSYHDNIVNLQGIAYNKGKNQESPIEA